MRGFRTAHGFPQQRTSRKSATSRPVSSRAPRMCSIFSSMSSSESCSSSAWRARVRSTNGDSEAPSSSSSPSSTGSSGTEAVGDGGRDGLISFSRMSAEISKYSSSESQSGKEPPSMPSEDCVCSFSRASGTSDMKDRSNRGTDTEAEGIYLIHHLTSKSKLFFPDLLSKV